VEVETGTAVSDDETEGRLLHGANAKFPANLPELEDPGREDGAEVDGDGVGAVMGG
jgi:hypothetical protein